MSEINLSTLSKRELRQLLDTSRERGQADAAYRILQEMAARRGDAPQAAARAPNRPPEARVIEVDLGDPMHHPDIPPMPNWTPPQSAQWKSFSQARAEQDKPAAAVRTPKPAPVPEPAARPVAEDDPYADWTDAAASEADFPPLRLETPTPVSAPRPRPKASGRRIQVCATFAVGFALGIGAGRELGDISHLPGPTATPVAARPAAPPVPPPRPAPPMLDEPRAAVATASIGPTSADFIAEPDALPDYDLPAPPPEIIAPPGSPAETAGAPGIRDERQAAPAQPQKKPQVATAEAAKPAAKSCARERTPADRSICADLRLQRLQKELRDAYAEALEAHDNRALLRQRQLAWASSRDEVTQPDRLARLYQDRIRKLNASTEAARRQ